LAISQYYHSNPIMIAGLRLLAHASGVVLLALIVVAAATASSCSGAFSRKYEYEEDVYLTVDGAASVYVNASVPALVALRGANLPLESSARLDRNVVRALYQSPVTTVESVSLSRRDHRRYVHLRIEVDDIRHLARVTPFAWSSYAFDAGLDNATYAQNVGSAAGRDVGDVGWMGDELVAFKLHLPSRISFHNSQSKTIERGNILVWEQPLQARLRGEPLAIHVRMERESILASTLSLFGLMILLVAATFAMVIWLVMRKGEKDAGSRFSQGSLEGGSKDPPLQILP
jgi:hypothetical protein